MRFVAGRGAVAKRQAENAAMAKMLLAGAPWRSCWQGHHGRVGGAGEEWQWHGNAAADWHGNARNAKEPAPADGTGPSQTFGCIQAEQSLVEDFVCLFLLGMRIYI